VSVFMVTAVVLVATGTLLCLGSLAIAYVTAVHFPGISSLTYRDAEAFRRVVFVMSSPWVCSRYCCRRWSTPGAASMIRRCA
jgi:hypothetical protein